MRAILHKQTWFVFLMLFVIGWSSIAFASSKTMQIDLSSHNSMQMSMQNTHQPVHQNMSHSMMHSKKMVCHNTSTEHCKMMLDQEQALHHSDCKECSTNHCQNTFFSLDLNIPLTFVQPINSHIATELNSHYLVRYSKGYLQDILRPPQA